MATRTRRHIPPLELLVLFVFDHGTPSVWITNIATGETTRTTDGTWQVDRHTTRWSDRAVAVQVYALNPPRGTSLWLRGTSSGDHEIDAPTMSFELANAAHADGMRFTLAAGNLALTVATGHAADHPDWLPDLTILPGVRPRPPGPNPPGGIPTSNLQDILTSPRVLERMQRIIDDRIANPGALHRHLRDDLASLANELSLDH